MLRALRPGSAEALKAAEARLLSVVSTPREQYSIPVPLGHINTVMIGADDKPPLVMLHGHGGGLAVFAKVFDGLAAAYRVYALDLLGWGRSSRPEVRPKGAGAAREWWLASLEAWRLQLGLERFTLLGHSMGGFIAASFALVNPSVLDHLILVSAAGMRAPVHPRTGVYYRMTPQRLVRLAGPFGPTLVARVQGQGTDRGGGPDLDLLDYYYQLSAAPGSGEYVFTEILGTTEWRLPLLPELPDLTLPVSLIWGEHDVLVPPKNGELAHAVLPESELILLEAEHQPFLETPEPFVTAILESPYRKSDLAVERE